uniref:Spire-type actin nucleation factor 1b n=1 Tax=Eptatretus burgeri TaxID=7764 RepID=A0A8C4PYD4_EPTBU
MEGNARPRDPVEPKASLCCVTDSASSSSSSSSSSLLTTSAEKSFIASLRRATLPTAETAGQQLSTKKGSTSMVAAPMEMSMSAPTSPATASPPRPRRATSTSPRARVNTEETNETSLEDVLSAYGRHLREEQAWAVCYQSALWLSQRRQLRPQPRMFLEPAFPCHLSLHQDGSVSCRLDLSTCLSAEDEVEKEAASESQLVEWLGLVTYRALDWGLSDDEERDLDPTLESLIDWMTSLRDGGEDEGYEAIDDDYAKCSQGALHEVLKQCAKHLPVPREASSHYQAVCRALFAEALELRTFLAQIHDAKQMLHSLGDTNTRGSMKSAELQELQNADWAQLWGQVMCELRRGVQLKHTPHCEKDRLPIEYALTPYEMLMADIRNRRYTLRKVMVQGDIPPRIRKSAHDIILDFIRSRPPLNPVVERRLRHPTPRPRSLHEQMLDEIRSDHRLRPVSPLLQRSHSEVNVAKGKPGRKRVLLKAPTLAELEPDDSSEEDLSPESPLGPLPPLALHGRRARPISATPQPQRRAPMARRHSIEKVMGTDQSFDSENRRNNSESLRDLVLPGDEVLLSVAEVMHIRRVLVKAELEKEQQHKEMYNALKKGKMCFCCRIKRFSIFNWSYTCQFCKSPVCAQCCKKMRLPHKHTERIPIGVLATSECQASAAGSQTTSACGHHSNRMSPADVNSSTLYASSHSAEWPQSDVCTVCQGFVHDVIASSNKSDQSAGSRPSWDQWRVKRAVRPSLRSKACTSRDGSCGNV